MIEAPILQSPNWDLPFKIMCNASDYVVGAVLGKWVESNCHMLCKQEIFRSIDVLYDDREGATGSGLRLREVMALDLWEQDHHLHRSFDTKVLAL